MNRSTYWSTHFANLMLGFLALTMILYMGSTIFIPILLASIIAFAIYPLVQKFEKLGFPEGLAIFSSMFIVISIIVLLIILIGAQLNSFITEIPTLINKFENLLLDIQDFIEDKFAITSESQLDILRDNMVNLFSTGTSIVRGTISTTTNILFYAALVPIYIFFMTYYHKIFRNFIIEISPANKMTLTEKILSEIKSVVQNYVGGLFLVILIIAALNSIGLLIVGIKYAVFFGCVSALLCIIPYFGVFMGGFITALYALLTGDAFWAPIGVIAVYGTIQFLEGNFITPFVMGTKVSLNPLVVIVTLLAGSALWGIAGMILSVPIIAVMKMVFDNIESLKPYGRVLGTHIPQFDINRYSPEQVQQGISSKLPNQVEEVEVSHQRKTELREIKAD
ncbi:MAG: AI-2E family transporter [Chitinophagales bacterium]